MNRLGIVLYRLGFFNPVITLEIAAVAIVAAVVDTMGINAVDQLTQSVRKNVFRIARQKHVAILVVAALPLLLRAALLPVYPAPSPAIHDEFSNILVADTFLKGRLTNPPHEFAAHLETFQSLQSPTYASFRPPGPGLAIAVGKMISGSNWLGVWLSTGLMCGAICWMLQGWMPSIWAMLGGLLASIQIGVLSYWMNSYWGGSVAALAGAVAMGAYGRFWRRGPAVSNSLLLAGGAALLMLTRPFEGALFCAGIGLPAIIITRRWPIWLVLTKTALPLAISGSLLASWLLIYNARVTGNAFTFPYQLGVQRNNMAPSFLWEHEDTNKTYSHEHLRRFHIESEMGLYRERQKVGRGWLYAANLAHLWQFFVRPALALPFIAGILLIWRSRKMAAMGLPAMIPLAAMPLANWHNPHYSAALTGIAYCFVVQGLRRMYLHPGANGKNVLRSFAYAVPAVCVITFVAATVMQARGIRLDSDSQGWAGNAAQWPIREKLARDLSLRPGKHLVLVRYTPQHDFEREWVQNEADIDGSKVVWARELGSDADGRLVEYFRDRQVWLLEADADTPRFATYAGFSQATVR